MNRLYTLFRKDLRQHLIPLIVLSVFMAAYFGIMMLGTTVSQRSMGFLAAESSFLLFIIPLGAVVLGNRLVVKEYYGRTQLFIESLPISRSGMFFVKYGIGLAFLLSVFILSLYFASLFSNRTDPVSAKFFLILMSRGGIFCYFVWSFLFAMGFLGRLRIPVYLLLGFSLIVVNITSEINFTRSGPLALVMPDTFPFERYNFPVKDLLITFLLGSGGLSLAFAVSRINEGSVSESLAKPMSQREKAVVGVIFIGCLLAITLLDEKRVKEPYKFNSKEVIVNENEPIEILYIREELKPDAEALNRILEKKVSALRSTLGLKKIPPIRVAFRDSLDMNKFETARLSDADGVLVRANFRDMDSWCIDDFVSYLVRAILDHATRDRTRFAPKQWLHDGFSCWWVHDGYRAASDLQKTLLLRSMYALKTQQLDSATIEAWPVFRERFGEPIAEAVAFSGLAYLQSVRGPEAVIDLVKEAYGRDIPDDSRETLYEIFHPMRVVFKEQTGEEWEDFISNWSDWINKLSSRPEFGNGLAAIPEASGSIEVVEKEGNMRDIAYGINFSHIPDSGYMCSLLHKKLPPFDSTIDEKDLIRDEKIRKNGSKSQTWQLTGTYNAGARVFLALEYDSDILGAPIRILSKRMNIE